jgi:hypothetical protein
LEAGLHDEGLLRQSLLEHHDKLRALHDKVELINEALAGGKSHDEVKDASQKLQKELADVYAHYVQGPHHPSHWRNLENHYKKHHHEEHTGSHTTTEGRVKQPFHGGYDPSLHHEHGLLSSLERGQHDWMASPAQVLFKKWSGGSTGQKGSKAKSVDYKEYVEMLKALKLLPRKIDTHKAREIFRQVCECVRAHA